MISINEYLDIILEDFEEYLRANPYLCYLKDVHYDGGRVPDYSDVHVQQLYLLRYAYAYAFEYKRMYQHLPEYFRAQSQLSVMSIGCGNMIDYWALAQVVGSRVDLRYRGFDSIDWAYKFSERENDRVWLTLGDAISAMEELPSIPADIIVFPKSISEFDHDAIDRFCECIRTKRILKRRVCVLVSLRTDQGSSQRDMSKTKKIYDAFLDAGFKTESHSNSFFYLAKQEEKIRLCDPSFKHPNEVVDLLIALHTRCAEYKEKQTSCEQSCIERLDRWPILGCRQMQWQMFDFEWEGD